MPLGISEIIYLCNSPLSFSDFFFHKIRRFLPVFVCESRNCRKRACRLLGNFLQPIRCTTQVWIVTRHQYGISALVSQTSLRGEAVGGVQKCWLFSQARVSLHHKNGNVFKSRARNVIWKTGYCAYLWKISSWAPTCEHLL